MCRTFPLLPSGSFSDLPRFLGCVTWAPLPSGSRLTGPLAGGRRTRDERCQNASPGPSGPARARGPCLPPALPEPGVPASLLPAAGSLHDEHLPRLLTAGCLRPWTLEVVGSPPGLIPGGVERRSTLHSPFRKSLLLRSTQRAQLQPHADRSPCVKWNAGVAHRSVTDFQLSLGEDDGQRVAWTSSLPVCDTAGVGPSNVVRVPVA